MNLRYHQTKAYHPDLIQPSSHNLNTKSKNNTKSDSFHLSKTLHSHTIISLKTYNLFEKSMI